MATLQRSVAFAILAASAVMGVIGCDAPETATGLVPAGPPKLRQVFMNELYEDTVGGITTLRVRSILAYGTHDAMPDVRTHSTTTAAANTQTIRVVFDEILRGNALEEIRCRTRQLSEIEACVVPGGYSRVPVGATPDDIADCAVANDLLDERCQGEMATCVNETGIPCGVDDDDENGSADNTRLIDGAVKIVCGTIEVPLDIEQSYWQPAGNQLVPARQSAESSLGPALVLKPMNQGRLPTSSTCHLELAGDVTDKDDLQVCTPPGGDPNAECTPGDLSGFSFGTEVLRLTSTIPDSSSPADPTGTPTIRMFWNAPLDPATIVLANFTVTPALPAPSISIDPQNSSLVLLQTGGNLQAATTYTVTISNVSDSFGVPLSAAQSFMFTTI